MRVVLDAVVAILLDAFNSSCLVGFHYIFVLKPFPLTLLRSSISNRTQKVWWNGRKKVGLFVMLLRENILEKFSLAFHFSKVPVFLFSFSSSKKKRGFSFAYTYPPRRRHQCVGSVDGQQLYGQHSNISLFAVCLRAVPTPKLPNAPSTSTSILRSILFCSFLSRSNLLPVFLLWIPLAIPSFFPCHTHRLLTIFDEFN